MRIAIIGSGIAGMTAAYRLAPRHDITLFEANDYAGGHTATVDVELDGERYAIDTGFIVFNDWTYPNFIALIEELGVAWQYSNMSFSLSCERTGLEYNGTSIDALFAQRINALRPSFLLMIADILRFNWRSRRVLSESDESLTLGEYLARHRYSRAFVERYIVPMGMAIWSSSERALLGFPVRFFVEFFLRHGFLNVNDRPVWRTIRGGTREYARRLTAPYRDRIRLRTPIVAVTRAADHVTLRSARGESERFDQVFIACHSDQALAMLQDASVAEREILGALPYNRNEAILHTDTRMLPRAARARAAWNYFLPADRREDVTLTYDMNILQSLAAAHTFMVTLNRSGQIDPARILGRYVYYHPAYSPAGVRAQARRAEISGQRRTFYCGAYWRFGFHEDGVVSAMWALEDFARATGSAPLVRAKAA
jgi:predicted NAD/FAD-binding protein